MPVLGWAAIPDSWLTSRERAVAVVVEQVVGLGQVVFRAGVDAMSRAS